MKANDESAIKFPNIVDPAEWQKARDALLVKEKAATHARDALATERRRLPMVKDRKRDRSNSFKGAFFSAIRVGAPPASLVGSAGTPADHFLMAEPPSASRGLGGIDVTAGGGQTKPGRTGLSKKTGTASTSNKLH